jgi:UrcA family protein
MAMKTSNLTRSEFAKFIVAASFWALGCTAIGGQALAQQAAATEESQVQANDFSISNATAMYPVRFSDLDIGKMQGVKTLYLRIRYAAEVVCESAATWGKKEGSACVTKAVDDAVARVNIPLLSQYHELRSKGDKAGLVRLAKAN